MKYLPVAKDGDQNKLETEALLFTRNNKRSGAFCTAFIAEMDVFFPLLKITKKIAALRSFYVGPSRFAKPLLKRKKKLICILRATEIYTM